MEKLILSNINIFDTASLFDEVVRYWNEKLRIKKNYDRSTYSVI